MVEEKRERKKKLRTKIYFEDNRKYSFIVCYNKGHLFIIIIFI